MYLNQLISNLSDKGLMKKEKIGPDQVQKHLDRAHEDLKVAAANLTIDGEASYNYAYLAMLRTGRALMLLEGYRPIDGAQHKTVIEFASAVLGKKYRELAEEFDEMRQRRNKFTYEPGAPVSTLEAQEAIKIAKEWVKEVSRIMAKRNPQLRLFQD
ncbi:MAG: HEPN domain-containing protein [Firmicutes bacterium]|nr:HEPN domain-containing protein [Bacillota bacterium]